MLDGNLRTAVDRALIPIGRALQRIGITADVVTVIGIVMSGAAAVAIGRGNLLLGFILLILTGIPDALDGAVAKAAGTSSKRGAFFDSVSDRLTDALLFGGLTWHYASTRPGHLMMLPVAVMASAQIISYQRDYLHGLSSHLVFLIYLVKEKTRKNVIALVLTYIHDYFIQY